MRRLCPRALLTVCLLHLGVFAAVAGTVRPFSPGSFGARVPARETCSAVRSAVADFDRNGIADRIEISPGPHGLRVSVNGGRPRVIGRHDEACRLLVADIDHDADPDLIALTKSGRLMVWRNDRGKLRLVRPRHAQSGLVGAELVRHHDPRLVERSVTGSDHACLASPATCAFDPIAAFRTTDARHQRLSTASVRASSRAPPLA